VSFEGREDVYLIDQLKEELAGVAWWATQGAMQLEEAGKPEFPVPERAESAVQMYHLQNNPFDHFLEERFMRNREGFVATELLWEQWQDWLKKNQIRNSGVPRNQLSIKIETQSSWPVYRHRPHGGKRGLRGLSLRKNFEDLS
jgi:phage/plasmid-associated DNA primase